MSKFLKNISIYIIMFVAVALLFTFLNTNIGTEVTFTDFVKFLNEGKINEMVVEEERVTAGLSEKITGADGKEYTEIYVSIPSVEVLYNHVGDIIREQTINRQPAMKVVMAAPERMPFWLSILPTIVIVIIFVIFWLFFMNQSQGGGAGGGRMMSFGKSKAKPMHESDKKKTFADVAGADEEKEELTEIVEFLKDPMRFTALGARIPKGVLLVGPPGTGKTLLAKAVAGEAGVPFFSIIGSYFVEMFVGVGASRVRDLFEQAKKNSPCIVFIDEIDAVGRHRGAGLGGGHDEREQTLNQLLVEMDGFSDNENIIVIAATNRADILDPALMRPGRFDRQIYVGQPDSKGREEILRVHSKNKPLGSDVKLEEIAKITYGFTGADLENLLNEGALLAARRSKKVINMPELDEAMVKVVVGTEKKSRVISDKDKELTAYHEAGHAILADMLETQDPVHQVSIIPRGRAGGYTMYLPDMDKQYISRQEMLEDIIVCMGGRVAELLIYGEMNTGASNDIQRATEIATKMVTRYGMSDALGSMTFGSEQSEVFIGRDYGQQRTYSEETAAAIDKEISAIINSCFEKCKQLMEQNRDKLEIVARALIKYEKIDGEQFKKILNGKDEAEEETVENSEN